ncbi:MAG: ASCH domain-containing protein [Hyphomonadaceae bacterium]|nr:ASCH domain-containing protein [Hyphomonadaceae bacterium]
MAAAQTYQGLKTFTFGDSAELADRLAALVVAGVKTGTCSAAIHGPDAEIGERQICLNSAGIPVCEIETIDITTLPFTAVTPEMAALEGEGDLSYRDWRDAHEAFFRREGSWAPDMDVIFETFRVTRVLDDAFASGAEAAVRAERTEAHAKGYSASEALHG